MRIAAKSLEALGIACVMIGLVQGILSETMWMELYLSIIGIVVFLVGWAVETRLTKKTRKEQATGEPRRT